MLRVKRFSNKAKYPAFEFIKSNLGYFLTHIVEDREIGDEEKIKCLENICVLSAKNIDDFQKKCNEIFFYNNKLKGRPCNNVNTLNPFVRVNDKDSLMSWIASLTGLKPSNVKNKLSEIIVANIAGKNLLLNSFINNLVISAAYDTEDKCAMYFGVKKWTSKLPPKLRDAHLCYYKSIQWSFPNPKTENLFVDQASVEGIKCRAGIIDKNKKIVFLHRLGEEFNVRKPTVFDAGFYEQFKPNGVTKPLKSCETFSGFDEYVHIPNKFNNLEDTIFETFQF